MDRLDVVGVLPIPLQHLCVSAEGLRLRRHRYGRRFWSTLEEAEDRLNLGEVELAEFRNERLRHVVKHCYETVPYYRSVFEARGLRPSDFRTVSDLEKLPIIDRSTVVRNWERFVSSAVPKSRMRHDYSGGTTGQALHFQVTDVHRRMKWATWWRYRRQHGLRFGMWLGLWAQAPIVPPKQNTPPYWRINWPMREVRFSVTHMSHSTFRLYLDELERRGVTWLHGFPSLLGALAQYMLDERVPSPGIQNISTGAENLLPHHADAIERAFGIRPIQHYGNCECVANISQCPNGSLHTDEDFSIVEYLELENGTPEKRYRVVGTGLWNDAMPLLRYDVGDVVTLSDKACSCGQWGRIVHSLDGRKDDMVICADGTPVVCFNEVLKFSERVETAQIYQDCPGKMVVRIVRRRGYSSADERKLTKRLRLRVSEEQMDVELEYVNEIERSPVGKHRMVVSNISANQP